MSSQLSLVKTIITSKSEEFRTKNIEVLVDGKEQPWFKWIHVRKFLRLRCTRRLTAKPADEDKNTRDFL